MDSVFGQIRSKLLLELKIQYAPFCVPASNLNCVIFYTYRTAGREELSSPVQCCDRFMPERRPQEGVLVLHLSYLCGELIALTKETAEAQR